MSSFDRTNFPSHLQPVPDSGGSAAPALSDSERQETPGLTPPLHRGHSRGFVTDVLVELGFTSKEMVQTAIDAARTAGRTPEALLLQQGTIDDDQLSRAIAERYGLFTIIVLGEAVSQLVLAAARRWTRSGPS